MTSAAIDHMVSITIFLAAILFFMNLFGQTIQTAVIYQQHRAVAVKCSDLLDTMLLSPGSPENWSVREDPIVGFGLQDPEFTQYQLSPFSLMRLTPSNGPPVYYPKTDMTYYNLTMDFGQSLYVPYTQIVNYSIASRLLGINGTYGFSLTVTPIVDVTVTPNVQPNLLTFSISAVGPGFPLAHAEVSYCFLTVDAQGQYPDYEIEYGNVTTDATGFASVVFSGFDASQVSHAFLAYAHLQGLTGMGYYMHELENENSVVPFVSNFETGEVLLAHSWDVHGGDNPALVHYNATFVVLNEDFRLGNMTLQNETMVGRLTHGLGNPYDCIIINTYTPGILIVTYRITGHQTGVVMMPWGINAMAFSVTFGGNLQNQEWVATDMRQVTVNNMAYQAKLALWSTQGYQVNG